MVYSVMRCHLTGLTKIIISRYCVLHYGNISGHCGGIKQIQLFVTVSKYITTEVFTIKMKH